VREQEGQAFLVELAPEPAALALVAGVFADLDVQVVHLQTSMRPQDGCALWSLPLRL